MLQAVKKLVQSYTALNTGRNRSVHRFCLATRSIYSYLPDRANIGWQHLWHVCYTVSL